MGWLLVFIIAKPLLHLTEVFIWEQDFRYPTLRIKLTLHVFNFKSNLGIYLRLILSDCVEQYFFVWLLYNHFYNFTIFYGLIVYIQARILWVFLNEYNVTYLLKITNVRWLIIIENEMAKRQWVLCKKTILLWNLWWSGACFLILLTTNF